MTWWQDAVFYEIYVRSFADSDGDGVGDLPGIRARLPYLRELGVDAIWLTPFYPSPGADHGYDVADYVGVDPLFGTLGDFDALVADAHDLGLRVIADLVPNHSSNAHPWFREKPEYYIWADTIPNNWPSVFGGPAWSFDEERGRYYLHLFAPEQPDLDWHRPDVRAEFERILRFWLDRGIDGFRIDVAWALFKDPELRDEDEPWPDTAFTSDWRQATSRPELHPLWRRWREITDAYDGERVLVGEITYSDPARVAPHVADGELHMAFNFTLLFAPWDAEAIRGAIDASLTAHAGVAGPPTWVLENHDVVRKATRFGGMRQARAAALLLLALPGPAFLYAGEELGLEEVDLPDALRQDPILKRSGGKRKGRDGCRVPIPWTRDAPGFGFTSGRPWLPIPEHWDALSVDAQREEASSTLALHRRALELRPQLTGALAWLDSPRGTLAFGRGSVVCLVNIDAAELPLPDGEVLLTSEIVRGDAVRAGASAWIRTEPSAVVFD